MYSLGSTSLLVLLKGGWFVVKVSKGELLTVTPKQQA